MNRIVIALFALFIFAVGLVPSARADCFTSTAATIIVPAIAPITYIDPACAAEAQMWGFHVGLLVNATTGYRCASSVNGATGCVQANKFLPSLDPIPGFQCNLRGYATMLGIGCCGVVCPPLTPNCEQN